MDPNQALPNAKIQEREEVLLLLAKGSLLVGPRVRHLDQMTRNEKI